MLYGAGKSSTNYKKYIIQDVNMLLHSMKEYFLNYLVHLYLILCLTAK
jgi:hypothetical protein